MANQRNSLLIRMIPQGLIHTLAVLLALSFTACQKSATEVYQYGDGVDLNGLPVGNGMLRAGESAPDPIPVGEPTEGESVSVSSFNDLKGVIISRTAMYKAGVTFNEYLLFNPMSNLIFPGNVLVGNSISNGRYVPVVGQEVGEIVWSSPDLSPRSPGFSFVSSVVNPNFSDYSRVLQQWNSIPKNPTATTTTFEVTEVNDLREFSAKFGIGLASEEVKAGFSLEGKVGELKTHILVKFIQKAYSISMDIPRRPVLQKADIASMDGVLPVYISDIFYGRMGYALISSDRDYYEVMAALQVMVPAVSFEISTSYKEILDTSLTQFVIIGGDSDSHGKVATEGWDGFKKALSAPLHSYDAVPVAMTLRYPDDNSVARVLLSGEYPVKESYFVKECDAITFSFRPTSLSAKCGTKEDLYVWGYTYLNVPANISPSGQPEEHRLVLIPMKNFLKVKQNQKTPLESAEEFDIKLVRPQGMSMQEFLNQKIELKGQFHNTNSSGGVIGDNLGKKTVQIKIQDLLFNAIHGQYQFSTRRNAYLDYVGSVTFDLFHDIEGIEEVPNTVIGSEGPDGTETRSLGNDPKAFFSRYNSLINNK